MINKKDKLAILILAGKVKLKNYSFKSHEYLFNIGNTLAFERILKNLDIDSNVSIYIAVKEINKKLKHFEPFKNAKFIEVGETKSILQTILRSIKKISEEDISIIPITTIPENSKIEKNSCYFGSKLIPKENWSAILKSKNRKYDFLYRDEDNSYGLNSYPCTGRLASEKKFLIKSIKQLTNKQKTDILSLAEILITKYNHKIIFEEWFDMGHEATYIDTKLSAITSRFFNDVIFNKSNNTIIKSSSDFDKLRGEYFYYKNLSKKLKNFFPYVYSEYENKDFIKSIEMEFIPFPNLSEIFLFKNIGPNAWKRIISSISKVFCSFYKEDNTKIKIDASWLYSLKLSSRFKNTIQYINNSNNDFLKIFLKKKIFLNNKFLICNLNKTYEKLHQYLLNYESSIEHHIGHGDLCFNNILVDQISGSLKLIDPKAFENHAHKTIGYVDANYDLAKLNHSFQYLYDSIVNNLYSIKIEKDNVDLRIYAPSEYKLVNELFNKILIKKNIDKNLLRVLTANLFISMLPLHKDDENRMICLAILGSVAFYDIDFNEIMVNI